MGERGNALASRVELLYNEGGSLRDVTNNQRVHLYTAFYCNLNIAFKSTIYFNTVTKAVVFLSTR